MAVVLELPIDAANELEKWGKERDMPQNALELDAVLSRLENFEDLETAIAARAERLAGKGKYIPMDELCAQLEVEECV